MYFVWHSLLKGGGLGLAVLLPLQYLPPTPKVVARVLSDVSIAVCVGVAAASHIGDHVDSISYEHRTMDQRHKYVIFIHVRCYSDVRRVR